MSELIRGTREFTCINAIWMGSSPSKGFVPVKISNAVIAAEYTSLRASAIPRETCSGDR